MNVELKYMENCSSGVEKTRKLPLDLIKVTDNFTVSSILLEHKPHTIQLYRSEYGQLIASTDAVIFEYMPDLLVQMQNNPLVTWNPLVNYREIRSYFSEAKTLASEVRKDIWCLDPAKNERFAMIRAPQIGMTLLGFSMMLTGALAFEHQTTVTRREFIKYLIVNGIALSTSCALPIGIEKFTSSPNPFFLDAEFRRLTVAAGLKQLGVKFKQQNLKSQNFLFLTSPAQWKGVKGWLEGSDISFWWNKLLSLCDCLDEQSRHSFFTAFQYQYSANNSYTKVKYPFDKAILES